MSQPEDQLPQPADAQRPAEVTSMPSEKGFDDPTRHLDALEEMVAADNPETAAAQVAQPEEVRPVEGVKRTNIEQTTTIEQETHSKGENRNRPEILFTPSVPFLETNERLSSITGDEVKGRREYGKWAFTVQQGMQRLSYAGAADDIFARKDAHWVQRLSYGNTKIGCSASSFNFAEGEVLTGENALLAAQRHLGIGGNFTAVMPHSGFFLTMKPPMEESILELNRQINQIKTEVGRDTYGLLLGAETGLINELVCRFALTSMTRKSIEEVNNLLDVISVHDINILLWAYLCTIYPNGFNHRSGCMADTTKCQHVEEDLINVRRLFFMDKARFTEDQLKHLSSSAAGSMTAASVAAYREQMRKNEIRTIICNEGEHDEVSFVMRVPSAREYFESTHRWIDSIGDKVIQALGADSSYNERNTLINEHAASTQMRKYSHWIESIHFGGGIINREKSGVEQIEKTLDAFSSSISLRDEFSLKVQEYVKDTCAALIGIPDYKCSHCGQYQITGEEKNPLHRSIVGIDVVMTFFTVLVQRAQLIKE